ncbi:MAG: helix-turn-helix domain-containing protein [Thermomicrobiales bacterium]
MHALDEEYLTVTEAATLLRVAPSTVRRWIREGDIRAYRLGQRRIGIRRTDLDALVTPVHPGAERVSEMTGDEQTAIRRLTPEEIQRGLEALERARVLREEITARRGGKPFPPSWEILNELRDERTRQLMGME